MPVSPTYPGVYVEELPSGVHTITGVSTAVTAFLGYFLRGPMNTATQIFSVADLERVFGPLDSRSEASYSIRQFFANGGAEAWVVRVAGTTTGANAITLAKATAAMNDAPAAPAPPKLVLTADARSEGSWGDAVRINVDYAAVQPDSQFNLSVTRVDASAPPTIVQTEVYRNLTLDPNDPSYAVAVVNNASSLVQLTAAPGLTAPFLRPARNGTIGSVDVTNLDLATLTYPQSMSVEISTAGPAVTLGKVTVAAAPASLADLITSVQQQVGAFSTWSKKPTVHARLTPDASGAGSHVQIWASVPDPAQPNDTGPAGVLTFASSAPEADLATTLGLDTPRSAAPQQYALQGGHDGASATMSASAFATALQGSGGPPKTGLNALDAVDDFNILCIPDVMSLNNDGSAAAVISAAETYCTPRWAFYIVDVPDTDGSRDQIDGMEGWLAQNATLRSSNAAVYFPRPQIPDPVNGYRPRSVASSGTIAGLYARTDGDRGVWKAPAGTASVLTNVNSLAYKLTDAENGVLNPLGINCLRSFPVYGNVCWGARTLEGADQIGSDWKYIPVRRTALYIEASLYRGTQWVVFEPNDEPLWSQIRLSVGTFMQGLFRQGAFQGATPAHAYLVKCDSETTTQADIDLGVVNILVGFAPLKPAEFVILQIQQLAGQTPT